MNKETKTAILLGASGLVGGFLLDMLLDSGMYGEVNIFVRKPLDKTHPRLKQHIVDFDNPATFKHLVKGDALFCCLGTTIKKAGSQAAFRKVDYEYPLHFAEMAKANGVHQYLIITAIGSKASSSIFYNRTKGECEDAIRNTGIESVSIFRPSLLLGKRAEFRLGEKLSEYLMRGFSFLMLGAAKKYRPVEAWQVAKAMMIVSEQPQSGVSIYESDRIQSF